jgi:ubiquinone/menaquinone biosynthesis C-methylase UbiE
MANEKYFAEIGEEGSIALDILDYSFNSTTYDFLLSSGIKAGMTVLDIGCGSGGMTCWLAQQVGPQGRVIAIENNENQLNAAKKRAEKMGLKQIEFKLCSAYDISTLNEKFDLVYCRFVLHHLNQPSKVIKEIFNTLKQGGIYVAEEGIVNYAFSFPYTSAWGEESTRIEIFKDNEVENERDGNFGIKLYNKMYFAGFKLKFAKIIHPLLVTQKEKNLLMLGRDETKNYEIEQGLTEDAWKKKGSDLQKIIMDDSQIIGFYASCQVCGVK